MRLARALLLIAILCSAQLAPILTHRRNVFAQEVTSAVTTDSLNLRGGPSTSSAVILVIPRGAKVAVTGNAKSKFLPVTYQGRQGWAHSDYLALDIPSGTPATTGTVTANLNLRIGPSTGQRAILVIPAGAQVTITGSSSNGFLAVTYGGYSGYAHGDWISRTATPAPVTPPATSAPTPAPVITPTPVATNGKVTESLNLRSQPNTSSQVLVVMPAGAKITLTGKSSGDFLAVQYNGKSGWAHKDWISITASTPPTDLKPQPEAPVQPPVTSISGTGRTTDNLNLRAQPNTNSAILVTMKAGSTITLTGETSGLFYKVTYNGQTGWAHRDWIEQIATTVTSTSAAQTTDAVILRSGPSTSYRRIMVVPANKVVTLTGQQSNGYHSASYEGHVGWIFTTYLTMDAAGTGLPVVSPGSVEQAPDLYAPITTNQGFHYTNAIVGPPRGTAQQAIEYAERVGALRMDQVELYINEIYRLAPILGFDPALIIAQSALETDSWRSSWWNDRLNPAGLGINDDPKQHANSQTFADGVQAARGQLAHMHAEVYGHRIVLPEDLQGADITYQNVFQAGWAGTIVTLDDLSNTWATDADYGWKISRMASYIFG